MCSGLLPSCLLGKTSPGALLSGSPRPNLGIHKHIGGLYMPMATLEDKILDQALSLPNDRRAVLVDRLLNSLGLPADEDVDRLWAEEAERRLGEIRSGRVETIPGDQVLAEIRNRLTRR